MKQRKEAPVDYKSLFEHYLVLHYKILFLIKFGILLVVSLLLSIIVVSLKTRHYWLGGFHIVASIMFVLLYLSTKRRYDHYKKEHMERIKE